MSPTYDHTGRCLAQDFNYAAIDGDQPDTYAEFCNLLGVSSARLVDIILAGNTPETIATRARLVRRFFNPSENPETFEAIGFDYGLVKQSVHQIFQSIRDEFELQTRLDRSGEARERIREGAKKAWERRRAKKAIFAAKAKTAQTENRQPENPTQVSTSAAAGGLR